jgi:hypothetical protein
MEIAGLAAAQSRAHRQPWRRWRHHAPAHGHAHAVWCETGGVPRGPGMYTDRARIEGGYIYAPEGIGFGTELRDETLEQFGVK